MDNLTPDVGKYLITFADTALRLKAFFSLAWEGVTNHDEYYHWLRSSVPLEARLSYLARRKATLLPRLVSLRFRLRQATVSFNPDFSQVFTSLLRLTRLTLTFDKGGGQVLGPLSLAPCPLQSVSSPVPIQTVLLIELPRSIAITSQSGLYQSIEPQNLQAFVRTLRHLYLFNIDLNDAKNSAPIIKCIVSYYSTTLESLQIDFRDLGDLKLMKSLRNIGVRTYPIEGWRNLLRHREALPASVGLNFSLNYQSLMTQAFHSTAPVEEIEKLVQQGYNLRQPHLGQFGPTLLLAHATSLNVPVAGIRRLIELGADLTPPDPPSRSFFESVIFEDSVLLSSAYAKTLINELFVSRDSTTKKTLYERWQAGELPGQSDPDGRPVTNSGPLGSPKQCLDALKLPENNWETLVPIVPLFQLQRHTTLDGLTILNHCGDDLEMTRKALSAGASWTATNIFGQDGLEYAAQKGFSSLPLLLSLTHDADFVSHATPAIWATMTPMNLEVIDKALYCLLRLQNLVPDKAFRTNLINTMIRVAMRRGVTLDWLPDLGEAIAVALQAETRPTSVWNGPFPPRTATMTFGHLVAHQIVVSRTEEAREAWMGFARSRPDLWQRPLLDHKARSAYDYLEYKLHKAVFPASRVEEVLREVRFMKLPFSLGQRLAPKRLVSTAISAAPYVAVLIVAIGYLAWS